MTQSVLLVIGTALATGLIMHWVRWVPRPLNREQREIGSAKDIGTRLDGARDRASVVELERNKLAVAKAVKAALWVTEARLNSSVPELLDIAQLWAAKAEQQGSKWKSPAGVSEIQGSGDPDARWSAWTCNDHHWRIEGQPRPTTVSDEIEDDLRTCKVFFDRELVLDMTISGKDHQVMWIDALTVGPWVSDLLAFAGAQTSQAQTRSSVRSAQQNKERADNIRW